MADTVLPVEDATVVPAPKDEVRALLDRLPDSVTLEDIQYHLGVVAKIRRSEARAEREGWLPHSEFERRLEKWLKA